MKRFCSPVIMGVTAALWSSAAYSADFYVRPLAAGPVTGTALSVVTLQSLETTAPSEEEEVAPGTFIGGFETEKQSDETSADDTAGGSDATESKFLSTASTDGATITKGAKWVSAPKDIKGSRGKGKTSGSTQTDTADTGGGEVSDGGTSGGSGSGETTSSGSTTTEGGSEGTSSSGTTSTGGASDGTTTAGTSADTEGGSTTTSDSTTTTGSTTTGGTTTTSGTTTTTGGTTTTSGGPTTTTSGTTSGGTTTPSQTWASVSDVFSSGQLQAGDRIFLMAGYHGRLSITGQKFSSPVVIAPAPGEVAHVSSIMIRDSRNFVIQGLKVWATSSNAGTGAMIRSYSDSSDLAFMDLDIRSVSSAGDYLQWTATDWDNNKRNGMLIAGDRVTIARNRVTGIYHGIFAGASNSLMEQNIVDGFAGDGMRSNGDNSIVRRNKVQNCVKIDGNHSDGFQAFSIGANGPGTGTIKNLTIEDNKIFEWVSAATSPIRCKLQGIGMFDGMYDGTVIRNNVIAVSNYHGLTVAGAVNSVIANNTVVHPDGIAGNRPWIKISNHKNGTPPSNVTIANNLATNYHVSSDPSRNILGTNNVVVSNATNEFVSFATQDFTLKSTALGVDAGLSSYAPADDIVGTARPKGKAPDAGAYENF